MDGHGSWSWILGGLVFGTAIVSFAFREAERVTSAAVLLARSSGILLHPTSLPSGRRRRPGAVRARVARAAPVRRRSRSAPARRRPDLRRARERRLPRPSGALPGGRGRGGAAGRVERGGAALGQPALRVDRPTPA